MNKENAKDYLPLVQALAKGKEIQVWNGELWIVVPDPDFIWAINKYRIKPERKTFSGFINIYKENNSWIHKSKESAKAYKANDIIACVPITVTYEEGEGL